MSKVAIMCVHCQGPGWRSLNLRSLISQLRIFSILHKSLLHCSNRIHTWQVSPQVNCSDTSQARTWYSVNMVDNQCFDTSVKLGKQCNGGNWLSSPHSRLLQDIPPWLSGDRWCKAANLLTHWGRVTHLCVRILTITDSDNGLSPGWHQVIIWTSAGILWKGPSGTHFSEILIDILTFSFKKMRLKMSSAKWQPFCLGLNVLSNQ